MTAVRKQLEDDSFKRIMDTTPAERVLFALELSNLSLQMHHAVHQNLAKKARVDKKLGKVIQQNTDSK